MLGTIDGRSRRVRDRTVGTRRAAVCQLLDQWTCIPRRVRQCVHRKGRRWSDVHERLRVHERRLDLHDREEVRRRTRRCSPITVTPIRNTMSGPAFDMSAA